MSEMATIIIVDDDQTVQASLKQVLQIAGYAVEAYASCREFIEHFRLPKSACLILDVHLQDMGAWEPVAFLRQRNIDIPVVLTSRAGDPAIQSQLSGPGTMAVLEKPIDRDLLLTAIKAALK